MSTFDTTTCPNFDRRGIIAYLGIAFGLAWAIWAVVLYRLKLNAHDHGFALALIPGMFAPAIAAIVVRTWVTGEGFAGAGLRPRLRLEWRYYLFALLLTPGLTGLIIALTVLFGVAEPHPHFRLGAASPPVALIIAIAVTPLLWGEEFGWRGYLQPRLLPGMPSAASPPAGRRSTLTWSPAWWAASSRPVPYTF
jgi:uncharacterized protein